MVVVEFQIHRRPNWSESEIVGSFGLNQQLSERVRLFNILSESGMHRYRGARIRSKIATESRVTELKARAFCRRLLVTGTRHRQFSA